MKIVRKSKIFMTWLHLFFRPKMKYYAQQSFVNEGFHVSALLLNIYLFEDGTQMEIRRHFECNFILSVAYRQMHSFLGSICLTASECFPIFIYSFSPAKSCVAVTARVR